MNDGADRDESGFSASLKSFISRAIDSIGVLEILLFIHAHRSRAWSAAEISRELRSNPTFVGTQLEKLSTLHLAEKQTSSESVLFLYRPSASDDELVNQLARQYAERKMTLIGLIYERRPTDHLKVFSDAFKFRKD